ncbi:MAG: 1-acyl-sn-glycerol-3-phosphate acyltransferase [Polyangiaceae bacterium]
MTTRALAQTYEPNPVLAYVYRRFFEHIHVDDAWIAAVREAASRGSVVYILRNLSFLDFLALDHLTKRHGLPRIRFANDLGLWLLEPMGKGWFSALRPQSREGAAEELTQVIEQGGSAALFLKRAPSALDVGRKVGARRSISEGDDLIRALFTLQRGRKTPILLVPQVFVWTKNPDRRQGGVVDALLGTRDWPGKIRSPMQVLRNSTNVIFRAGEPVDLAEFLETPEEVSLNGSPTAEDDDARVRRLTYALLRRLERERRTIVGPVRKGNDRMRSEIIKSPRLQEIIKHLAGEGAKERQVLNGRAYEMLRELESQPEPAVIRMFDVALDTIVNRIYDGVEVDQAGLERVRQASKRGTLVLLPSHKSHLDYLMLSFVFYHANLQPPLIAAGDNLSFFPLGIMLRRGGAFFIRRSFSGDRLYGSVVDAYVRRLIREGYSIEFFLEGGRSRTGKLLPPKLGLLNMVVEAALAVPNKELYFVPVSIGYDRLVEGSSYVRELTGGEKQEEDARGLLKTTGVLRGRYGRLNIQFGDILTLRDIRSNGEGEAPKAEDRTQMHPAKRRALVTRLAHRVMSEINRATAVTPGAVVATALLNHPHRGVSHGELTSVCGRLIVVLKGLGARISHVLLDERGGLREEAIRDAAQLFIDADTVVATVPGEGASIARSKRAKIYTGPDVMYVVPDDKRLSLDLSKNIIVHFFVPRALVATGLSSSARGRVVTRPQRTTQRPPSMSEPPPPPPTLSRIAPIARATLEDRVRNLSRLFKFEFMFRADGTFEQNFAETLGEMIAAGELMMTASGEIAPGPGHDGWSGEAWIDFYASVARTFLESYRVAARGLTLLQKGPASQKDLVKKALGLGERMFLAGEIERPEAVTRPTIGNAYLAFADQGYVSVSQGKVSLAESFATSAAVGAIEAKIAGYSSAEEVS